MKKTLLFLFVLIASITFISCDFGGNETTTLEVTTSEATTLETTTVEETTLGTTTVEETTTLETTTVEATTTIVTVMTTTEEVTTTELPTTTEAVTYTSIEVTNQTTKYFRLDEELDKDTIELTAYKSDGTSEIVLSDLFSVRGYSSTTAGEKTLFIIFDRYMVQTTVYVLEDYAFEINMEYYMAAINLDGDVLKVTLNNIINENFEGKLYGDARDILQESDEDPNNPDNVMLVYTGYSVDSTWDSGVTWNREHVWPQSRLGVYVSYDDDFVSKATDLHNLKPANPGENSSRSNDYFSTVSGSDFYQPRNEVKGDIARILFYMSTMYFDLSLNEDEMSSTNAKTMGMLSMLLAWNELDPVDDFERNRNEVIYSYQGNRNPFIDYPEFVNLIWGTTE